MKFVLHEHNFPVRVASFAEAWIEIMELQYAIDTPEVASFAEAWIEITPFNLDFMYDICRLLRGGVD